jgi:CBS domain-containing protein
VVGPGTTADEARRAIVEGGMGWVSVVDGDDLLGWIDESDLASARSAADTTPHRFSAYVTVKSSLRTALDSIVTSETNVAVVVSEGQRYLGILTMERLTQEITQ